MLACGGALAAQVPGGVRRPTRSAIVNPYLEIQTQDKFDDVKGPAGTLASQAAALGQGRRGAGEGATTFAAKDVKSAREAFGPLSDALMRGKADGSKDSFPISRSATAR